MSVKNKKPTGRFILKLVLLLFIVYSIISLTVNQIQLSQNRQKLAELEQKQQEQQNAIAADRKSQVGTGDRSESIRTYNFPQGRVTDHRIGLTLYKIDTILNGDLDEIVEALITAHRAEQLQNQQNV